MSEPVLRGVKLRKEFENGRVVALADVSLEILAGEAVAIVGPSGSGKTTLLHVLGTLEPPTAGEVWIGGRRVVPGGAQDEVRAKEIGFVFQLHNLILTLTALENVEMPMLAVGAPRSARRARARELLDRMGLGRRADFVPARLSGGERQRVAIARALANRPRVLLGDEPTGSLDSRTGREIVDLLLELRRSSGLTVVLVTHNPDIAARMDRVVELRDGRLV